MDCIIDLISVNYVCPLLLSVLGDIEPSSDKDCDVFMSCFYVLIVYRYKINLFKSNGHILNTLHFHATATSSYESQQGMRHMRCQLGLHSAFMVSTKQTFDIRNVMLLTVKKSCHSSAQAWSEMYASHFGIPKFSKFLSIQLKICIWSI